MNKCEWNPEANESACATYDSNNYVENHYGCQNEATIMVGANGQWHLCESCAKLPKFKRFRVRKPLKT